MRCKRVLRKQRTEKVIECFCDVDSTTIRKAENSPSKVYLLSSLKYQFTMNPINYVTNFVTALHSMEPM